MMNCYSSEMDEKVRVRISTEWRILVDADSSSQFITDMTHNQCISCTNDKQTQVTHLPDQ